MAHGISLSLSDLLLGGVQGHTGREGCWIARICVFSRARYDRSSSRAATSWAWRAEASSRARHSPGASDSARKAQASNSGPRSVTQEDEHAGGAARAMGGVSAQMSCQLGGPAGLGARRPSPRSCPFPHGRSSRGPRVGKVRPSSAEAFLPSVISALCAHGL